MRTDMRVAGSTRPRRHPDNWGPGIQRRKFSPSPCGLRLSHKCGTIFLRITNGMTGRPSPVAQRLPADRSESHLPPEDFSTVIEGTSQHTSAIYSFRIRATPVALAGGGWGEGSYAMPVRVISLPPAPSRKGRGRVFSVVEQSLGSNGPRSAAHGYPHAHRRAGRFPTRPKPTTVARCHPDRMMRTGLCCLKRSSGRIAAFRHAACGGCWPPLPSRAA